MRNSHKAILAGSAALLVTGAAFAATGKTHQMEVALPDGSVAHIEYVGDVAPKVTVEPAERTAVRFGPVVDPFADLDRLTASMQAQHREMMRQLAALERNASRVQGSAPGQLVVNGNLPAGSQFTMVQSSTDANGCTRTVRYSSDGSSEKPQRTQTSSGKCGKAEAEAAPEKESTPASRYVPGAV
jgi:hypothetical protein